MTARKRKIDLAGYKRAGLLAAFKDRQMPCFSTTCNVEITALQQYTTESRYNFFVTITYVLSRALNQVAELRHRLINEELYEFDRVHPGYTILLQDSSFSFCDSMYFDDFETYYDYSVHRIAHTRNHPDQSTSEKHHMFFVTNVPWFSFTA
jgi:chloramphenicol O-acetyltransferase type A